MYRGRFPVVCSNLRGIDLYFHFLSFRNTQNYRLSYSTGTTGCIVPSICSVGGGVWDTPLRSRSVMVASGTFVCTDCRKINLYINDFIFTDRTKSKKKIKRIFFFLISSEFFRKSRAVLARILKLPTRLTEVLKTGCRWNVRFNRSYIDYQHCFTRASIIKR